jgi:hypothetical protein
VADSGAAIQPAELTSLTCPRCRFPAPMIPLAALEFRCARCEWPFTLSAPSVSSPAVPATTVAAANTTGTVVAVAVTGGTVTAVTVNGTQAGTADGTYLVPAGGTIAVTYSAAPAWTWTLPEISASVSAGGAALTFAPAGTNVAFAAGQVLIVDPSGTPDVVVVTGTPTATSVPVNSLNSAHSSGVTVTVAQLAPALSSETVPQTSY